MSVRNELGVPVLGVLVCAWMIFGCPLLSRAQEADSQSLPAAFAKVLSLQDLAGNEHWEVIHRRSEDGVQELRLHHFKWMMDFLHWRPLTEERQKLNMASVRHLLRTFWGPAMPFELTGVENTLTINGHPAFEVEGTLGEGRIRTRFIVWNCPQSKRQFIADLNINQELKTPRAIFDMERQSALTIRCHGAPYSEPGEGALDSVYANGNLGISFLVPASWHTEIFTQKQWYPDGATRESGSLWTLLTDSEKGLHLFSWKPDGPLTGEALKASVHDRMCTPFSTPDEGVWRVTQIDLGDPTSGDGFVSASGWITSEEKGKDWTETKPHRVTALLYDDGGVRYLVVATMAAWKEMWRRPVDLTPSPTLFEEFVRSQVRPALRNWPVGLE